MPENLRRLFRLDQYTNAVERFRAAATYVISIALLVLNLGGVIALLPSLPSTDTVGVIWFLLFVLLLPGGIIAAMLFTRAGRQVVGGAMLTILWFALVAYSYFLGDASSATSLSFVLGLTGVMLSALLLGARSVPYATGFVLLINFSMLSKGRSFTDVVAYDILLLMNATGIYILAHAMPNIAARVVAESEAKRLHLAEFSNQITQKLLSTRLNLGALLKETVSLIRPLSADIGDVQLFMIDADRRNATLVASTRQQASLGEQVGIGSLSVIGRVTITGQTITARDTLEERPYRRSAFLEGARAELALPLKVGEDTIGVLDVQSSNPAAFTPESIRTLEALANQVAIVIDNARLFNEAQRQVQENRRLFEQARNNLREIERLNRQLTGSAWSEYLRSRGEQIGYSLNLENGQVEDFSDWTPTMAEAARSNQVLVRQAGRDRVVALPITIRGHAIGAMEFEIGPDQDFPQDQLNTLQQLIERVGLAIENTRLLEETQRVAQREALVNEISARMQVTTNVEAVIAAATQSLADAFHAPRVAIRLGTPDGS